MKEVLDPVFEIESANQFILKKNWAFFFVPLIILCLLLLDLFWEVLRNYQCNCVWPWKFTVLGVSTAASLAGVFAGLILTREQFAKSMKPNLSWSTEFMYSIGVDGNGWSAHLGNFGPGPANIESIKYSIKANKENYSVDKQDISRKELIAILVSLGLIERTDFYLKLITKGCPLAPIKQTSEGIEVALFKPEAFKFIIKINFHVVVSDIVGDLHIKSLPFRATLPEEELRKQIESISNIIILPKQQL